MNPLKSIKWLAALLVAASVIFGLTATAYAHGVIISYNVTSNGQVDLYAEFDTGEAMTEAQVTIYAPSDPINPWLVGTSDTEGRFVFTLDPEQLGTWDIQYRKAGHGDIIHFELEAGMIDPTLVDSSAVGQPVLSAMAIPATESEPAEAEALPAQPAAAPASVVSGGNTGGGSGFTSLQILLMSASVIWGFVGTALYFSNKGAATHDHSHEAAHGHPH